MLYEVITTPDSGKKYGLDRDVEVPYVVFVRVNVHIYLVIDLVYQIGILYLPVF